MSPVQTDVLGTMGSCWMQTKEPGCHTQASQAAAQAIHSTSASCDTRTSCSPWPLWKAEPVFLGVWWASPYASAFLEGAQICAHLAGVHYVFDTAFSRNLSLLESQREFTRRFRGQADSKQALPVLTSACPGVLSST